MKSDQERDRDRPRPLVRLEPVPVRVRGVWRRNGAGQVLGQGQGQEEGEVGEILTPEPESAESVEQWPGAY